MEPALGLSYPTIRSRLTDLKNKLSGRDAPSESPLPADSVKETLELLEKGKITFDEAMAKIKRGSKK